YGIVLDAGSSHTAMFVYKWPADKENDTGVVSEHSMCDVEGPGISSYRLNPPAAGTSLEHCLNQALSDVPRDKHVGTPLYLGATAGMRLLKQGLTSLLGPSMAVLASRGCRDREGSAALWHTPVTLPSHLAHSIADPQVSDAVLRAVAATLKMYPFDFRGAKILSGEEEGVFGWVTANYLLENFIKRGWLGEWIQPQKKTLGAMDFGGASTQITFETRDTIENPRNKVILKLYGQTYKVYTHSFLCYGRDQVLKRLLSKLLQAESYQATVSHPCWPMGYNKSLLLSSIYDSPCTEKERPSLALNTTVTLVGTGNGNLCALHVSKLFDFTNCSFSHCSFDGVFQPKVSGNFIAFSAFFYTVDFIQTVMGRPVHLPSDLKDAAETICATSWSELLQKAPKLEKRLPDYCAVSTFVYLLTTKGYSFNNQSFPNIAFQKKVAEKPSFHKSMLYNYWVILILLFVVTTLTSLVTAICLLRYSKSSVI
ncbi:Ectonucleoside triphosphate diphosphohydrolase 2, partial [Lamprotornis superbus]